MTICHHLYLVALHLALRAQTTKVHLSLRLRLSTTPVSTRLKMKKHGRTRAFFLGRLTEQFSTYRAEFHAAFEP